MRNASGYPIGTTGTVCNSVDLMNPLHVMGFEQDIGHLEVDLSPMCPRRSVRSTCGWAYTPISQSAVERITGQTD